MIKLLNTVFDLSDFIYNKISSDKLIGIYKITSPIGKIYIGQSINILKRFYTYKRLHCKKQIYLYNSFIKYGVLNHTFEIIGICSEDELNGLEIQYEKIYNSTNREFGLNLRECGFNSKISDETKKKLSIAHLGKKKSYEARLKMSLSKKGKPSIMDGKKHSEESKLKMSEAKKGKPSKIKGIKHSEESKLKMSQSLKGRKVWNKGIKMTFSQKQKMFNRHFSDETRRKMSDAKKGKKQSQEIILKRTKNQKGRIMSEETRRKLSEKAKIRNSIPENTTFYNKKHTEESKKIQSIKRSQYWQRIKQERLSMIF